MNNRKKLLGQIILEFPDSLYKPHYTEYICDELQKYKNHIPKNKYSVIKSYLSLTQKSTFTNKDINKMHKLVPSIIKIINKTNLPDDYYTSESESSDSSEYIIEDNESSVEEWEQKYINQIKDLSHKNKILDIKLAATNKLLQSLQDMISILENYQ